MTSQHLVCARFKKTKDGDKVRFTAIVPIEELLAKLVENLIVDKLYIAVDDPDGKGYGLREIGDVTLTVASPGAPLITVPAMPEGRTPYTPPLPHEPAPVAPIAAERGLPIVARLVQDNQDSGQYDFKPIGAPPKRQSELGTGQATTPQGKEENAKAASLMARILAARGVSDHEVGDEPAPKPKARKKAKKTLSFEEEDKLLPNTVSKSKLKITGVIEGTDAERAAASSPNLKDFA